MTMLKTTFADLARERLLDDFKSESTQPKIENNDIFYNAIEDCLPVLSGYFPLRKKTLLAVYVAPDDDYLVVAESISGWAAGGTATLAQTAGTAFGCARNITMKIVDSTFAITALSITVTGKLFSAAQTKTFALTDGMETTNGYTFDTGKLFTSLTSIVAASVTGTTTGCTIQAGLGSDIYNGVCLPSSGNLQTVDISGVKDRYGQKLFKNVKRFRRVAYPAYADTSTTGTVDWHSVQRVGDDLVIDYDGDMEITSTNSYYMLVEWEANHTLTVDESTLDEDMEQLLIEGVVAKVLQALGSKNVNEITDGVSVGAQWIADGERRYKNWEMKLMQSRTIEPSEYLSRS